MVLDAWEETWADLGIAAIRPLQNAKRFDFSSADLNAGFANPGAGDPTRIASRPVPPDESVLSRTPPDMAGIACF